MHQPVTDRRAPLPVLRAGVFAVVGAVLGMSAHQMFGEAPVPWGQGSAVAVGLFGLGLVGARRRRHVGTVVVCSVAGQSGLHLWLTFTAHAAHSHAHMHDHPGGDVSMQGPLAMGAGHALAAALVAVLLHRADEACWTLARGVSAVFDAVGAHVRAARVLSRRPGVTGPPGAPVRVATEDVRPPRAAPVLAYAVVRRGPPPVGAVLVD